MYSISNPNEKNTPEIDQKRKKKTYGQANDLKHKQIPIINWCYIEEYRNASNIRLGMAGYAERLSVQRESKHSLQISSAQRRL